MALSQVYSKRVKAILAVSFLALLTITLLRRSIGFLGYAVTLVLAVTVIFVALVRQTWKDFPRELDVASEQAMTMRGQIEKICDAVPNVVKQKHWKLVEADSAQSRFKVSIGRSIWTMGGQEMVIDVKKAGDGSTTVNVRCEAIHQTMDWGKNQKHINTFFRSLEKTVKADSNPTK